MFIIGERYSSYKRKKMIPLAFTDDYRQISSTRNQPGGYWSKQVMILMKLSDPLTDNTVN